MGVFGLITCLLILVIWVTVAIMETKILETRQDSKSRAKKEAREASYVIDHNTRLTDAMSTFRWGSISRDLDIEKKIIRRARVKCNEK